VIGQVRAQSEGLTIRVGDRVMRAPLERLARAYHDAIPNIMNASIAELAVLEQHPQPSGA
jgi:predicted transcriptional regulator